MSNSSVLSASEQWGLSGGACDSNTASGVCSGSSEVRLTQCAQAERLTLPHFLHRLILDVVWREELTSS